MNRRVTLGSFELHDQPLVHDQIESCLPDGDPLIQHADPNLPDERNIALGEFDAERFLVAGLQKPRS